MQSDRLVGAVLLLASAFLVGCLTGRATAGSSPRAALERTIIDYDASTATKDPDAIVRMFRPDVVVLSPQSREAAVGLAVNRTAWARFFALPTAEHTIHTTAIVMGAAGDLAFTRGVWTAAFSRPDGTRVPGRGELVTIWRRDATGAAADPTEWRAAVVMAHRVE